MLRFSFTVRVEKIFAAFESRETRQGTPPHAQSMLNRTAR